MENTLSQFESFLQSIESLQLRLQVLLPSVKRCADSVGRFSKLADLRDREQAVLNDLYAKQSTKDLGVRQEQHRMKIADWDKEIRELSMPSVQVERERRVFVDELKSVLNATPVDPPLLREVRKEIERLQLLRNPHLGMQRAHEDLLTLRERLTELGTHLTRKGKRALATFSTPDGATWEEVNIRFLGDHRIEVEVLGHSEFFNYVEAGFENRKTKNPNNAWVLLREFARQDGKLERSRGKRQDVTRMEKGVQAIRKRLKEMFGLQDDPFLPFHEVKRFQTRFKLAFPHSEDL